MWPPCGRLQRKAADSAAFFSPRARPDTPDRANPIRSARANGIFAAVTSTNPAIVSQAAVRRLPRLALLLLCAAYVLPGFLGREPWKNADVAALGVMLEMASGASSWWTPQLLGVTAETPGWLPYWLGAAFIWALPFVPPDWAARLPFIGLLGLTLANTWYAVYHLARQPAAQPVAFAFGGEARPADYARSLADAGLLALLASLGLAQMSHETTPDLARLAMVSGMLLGAARLAHAQDTQRWRSVLIWAVSTLALALSGVPWVAMALGGCFLLAVLPQRLDKLPHNAHPLLPSAAALWLLVVGGFALFDAMPLPLWHLPTTVAELSSLGRLLVWFTWPAWPLVLWTLWGWRNRLRSPHVMLPFSALLVTLLYAALSSQKDRHLLMALPPMAALAAFALPTLRRSVSSLIDWFTLLFFSACALAIWVIWLAMQTGVPAKPAANVARLAPGFVPEFSLGLWLLGTVATLAWIWLVVWRTGRNRQALWKSLVLPAAGATLCWVLLMTLWLPLLDFGRSYGPLSRSLARLVPPDSPCVLADGLSQAQIAALQYQGQLRLVRTTALGDGPVPASQHGCRAMVVSPETQPTLDERVLLTDWAYKASVSRLTDRRERLLVYLRIAD